MEGFGGMNCNMNVIKGSPPPLVHILCTFRTYVGVRVRMSLWQLLVRVQRMAVLAVTLENFTRENLYDHENFTLRAIRYI